MPIIRRLLEPLPGVVSVPINVTAKQTVVEHDPQQTSAQQLVLALNQGGGLDARVKADSDEASQAHANRYPKWNVCLSGVLWAISLLHYGGGTCQREGEFDTQCPEYSAEFRGNGTEGSISNCLCNLGYQWHKASQTCEACPAGMLEYLKYVAIASVFFALPAVALRAFKSLRQGLININVLMILAVIGAMAIQDFVEGAAVLFLFSLSEWLESRSTDRARDAISAIISLKPESAQMQDGSTVGVEEVKIGDIVTVKAGDKVPIDGVVVSGSSTIDESSLTGESHPVSKKEGDSIFGGTISLSGFMVVQCEAAAEDSAVARLVKLVQEAQMQRSPTELMVDRLAGIYTPLVVVAALLTATIPWTFMEPDDAQKLLYQALVLLVVACPCALVISTPITYVCALTCAVSLDPPFPEILYGERKNV